MLDSNGTPWILEINANPSFNIEATSETKKTGEFTVSPIDLHVKSMVLSHAIKLCLKPVEKMMEYEEYDSYTQIFSPDIEEEILGDYSIYDDLLDIFLEVSG